MHWAYNRRVPWVADAFWGPGGPQPGQKYALAAFTPVWFCPEGTQATYYEDWPAVRRWWFCRVSVTLDPMISEASACTSSTQD